MSTGSGGGRQAAPRLEIVNRPIDALTLDPKNPRRHSRRQVLQIARSIKAFGFNVPVLVDTRLKVIAGHGRLLACQELGWRENRPGGDGLVAINAFTSANDDHTLLFVPASSFTAPPSLPKIPSGLGFASWDRIIA